ncbi:NAD(P)-binding protein [Tuber magnatum]|uniref:NAD(P)-binding protein n=1 Tax=Tuber magnatum TaxID=42249 RepID=A0A317SX24_9PEZI|nr:NAD(P)-binding protein [Tuber magnatum]
MPLQLKESDLPSLTSKNALVTGATSGIGLQTAILLASHGATVHIASRNTAKGQETVRALRAEYPSHTYYHHPLDLSSVSSAAESAALFARENTHLDILVANAGVAFVSVDELSVDVLDKAFAVNHVGHFVFISGLLPLLRRTAEKSGDVRVVVTSSNAYKFVDKVDLSDVACRVPGDGRSARHFLAAGRRYGRSKRANILFAMELDRRLRAPDEMGRADASGVRVNVCHPGTIGATSLGGDGGLFGIPVWTSRLLHRLIGVVGLTPREGAMTQTLLAAADKIREEDVHGCFFAPRTGWNMRYTHSEEVDLGEWARSEEDAKALWEWTEGWVDKVLGKGNPGGE